MEEPRRVRRGGGRAARVATRTADVPEIDAAPPGQRGGAYRPLTEEGIDAILATAYRLLDEIGMAETPPMIVELAEARGARINELGRLSFPRGLIDEIVAGAAKEFTIHGLDEARAIHVGGEAVHYGTGGAAVQTLDMESGLYRPSTLADLHDFTRLQDRLTNISWFTRCCVATDVEDSLDLDINTAYALIRNTTKPVGTSFTLGAHVAPAVEMFDMALGGPGRFRERPFCHVHISPVISPLRFGEDAVDVAAACVEHGLPINCIIAAQSGATAPATLAGFLAQSVAETLAGLAMVNLMAPGHPVIFSNWPLVIDLRSGAFCGGGGESSVMNAAAAQIANRLGLISGVAASMADAKAVDWQMGAEKAMSALACGLAGANMVFESAGMTASLLGASFEAFVLDDEMLGHAMRTIRGVEIDEERLGFDAIRDAVLGEGHFLGHPHTMAAMQRDWLWPRLADRDPPVTWAEKGAPDAWGAAKARAREILDTHHPDHLAAVDGAIRDRYRIIGS